MTAPASRSPQAKVRPAKLAHCVIRTTPERLRAMVHWYRTVLEAEVAYENAMVCFMTYDEEHHRVAIAGIPGLRARPDHSIGVDHVAFTYAGLGDLMHTFERLAGEGIRPALSIHHGPTLSLYYLDPDKNQIELQIDVFDDLAEQAAFLSGEQFARNPIGVPFDADELLRRHRAGVPEAELKQPLEGAPPGPRDFPIH